MFGLAKGTVCIIVNEVCYAIVKVLLKKYVKLTSHEQIDEVVSDYRSIGHMFGVAKGTVCIIVDEVCYAIVKVLLKKYVKLPSHEQIDEVVSGFETP